MIALTKEKREELIVCANEIKKMSTSTHGYKVGNDAFGSNALMLMDVAIAALTADIFGHVDGSGLNFYRHPSATIEYALTQGDEVTTLFTAPPVPEIKLPDDHEGTEHTDYHSGKKDGWNECLAEIKHLNGLGE